MSSKRVAIYTRKSTSEGLDQEFNSLDAQREAVEAYVRSQSGKGWSALPERYDDGGYTGANTDRPAFQRLLQDIDAGGVDAVAVYKIDRLSRSLVDFARVIDLLDDRGVAFVSVTQDFNTTNSMGKLTLNILMSFAQFEREVIAERTRDKIVATRKRGDWTGGTPVLGYEVSDKKLTVNAEEAAQVREIFAAFLRLRSFPAALEELDESGVRTKRYTANSGRTHGGRKFDKASLRRLLQNPLYVGDLRAGKAVVSGNHEAIIDRATWDGVQGCLKGGESQVAARFRSQTLLSGLLWCDRCGERMLAHSTSKGAKRYRYYVCQTQLKQGARACPESRVAAPTLEDTVVERLRSAAQDPKLLAAATRVSQEPPAAEVRRLEARGRALDTDRARLRRRRRRGLKQLESGNFAQDGGERLRAIETEIDRVERERDHNREAIHALQDRVDEDDLLELIVDFLPLWEELLAEEQRRVLELVVERLTYSGEKDTVDIQLRDGSSTGKGAQACRSSA